MAKAKAPKESYATWLMNLRASQWETAGVTVSWRGTTAFDAHINGVLVASMERQDDKFVLFDFAVSDRALEKLSSLPKLNKYYLPSPYEGRVRIRLGKDPVHALSSLSLDAWLALSADVQARGATALERAKEHVASFLGGAPAAAAAPRNSLTSTGSGYVAMSEKQARRWKRSEADLDALLRGGDAAAIVETSVGPVLSLGTPDTLHVVPRKDALLLVRVVSAESEDDLEARFAAIRGTRFKALKASLEIEGKWVVFDSGLAGAEAIASDDGHLPLALSKGSYAISHKVETKDDDEFLVVRLARRVD